MNREARKVGGITLDTFFVVYILIAVATFSHTMQASAAVFEGMRPTTGILAIAWWWISGFAFAVAVDAGMVASSEAFARTRNPVLLLSFVFAALGTAYTQLIYSMTHAAPFEYAAGVTTYWRFTMTPLIEARTIIMPLMLPGYAVVYTIARIIRNDAVSRIEFDRLKAEKERLEFEARKAIHEKSLIVAQQNGRDVSMVASYGYRCTACNRDYVGHINPERRLAAAKSHISRTHGTVPDKTVALNEFILFFGGDGEPHVSVPNIIIEKPIGNTVDIEGE